MRTNVRDRPVSASPPVLGDAIGLISDMAGIDADRCDVGVPSEGSDVAVRRNHCRDWPETEGSQGLEIHGHRDHAATPGDRDTGCGRPVSLRRFVTPVASRQRHGAHTKLIRQVENLVVDR